MDGLRSFAAGGSLVLLDYEINCDMDDTSRPLSHACLIKRYIGATGRNDMAPPFDTPSPVW